MKVTLGQLSCKVGDIEGNCAKIVEAAKKCSDDFFLTPELSICGYPPEDLLAYGEFIVACEKGAQSIASTLAKEMPSHSHVLVGLPRHLDGKVYNVMQVLNQGKIVAEHKKTHLPNYGVFDEMRYFTPGRGPTIWQVGNKKIALGICHDIWQEDFRLSLHQQQADLVLIGNASPFYIGVQDDREKHTCDISKKGAMVAYVNLVGGQDEHVFDGGSHVALEGKVIHRAPSFNDCVTSSAECQVANSMSEMEQVQAALLVGVHDYVSAAGGGPVFVGVSGGIDSAVVLCLAAQAVGAGNVTAVMMPSKYTADMSLIDGKQLASNLGVKQEVIEIEPIIAPFYEALQNALGPDPKGVTLENLQSRVRGNILMALANNTAGLVLTTGNKSEMATGYATLYGDMAGAFDALKDLTKQRVYALARHFNQSQKLIPERILERPPTAELREGQLDSDSLPDYEVLDDMLECVVEQLADFQQVAAKHGTDTTSSFMRMLANSEFKRRQAPIGPTLTKRAFGKDWRMPVMNRYKFGDKDSSN